MDSPRRLLAITLSITVGCALGAWAVHVTRSPDAAGGWRDGLVVLLVCCAGYGAIALPFNVYSVRKHDRIQRGVGALARWTVSPEEWQRFAANERARDERTTLSNMVAVGMTAPPAGVNVVIAKDAVVVGRELHRLSGITVQLCRGPRRLPSTPPTLEYEITMIDPNDTYVQRAIRFPLPLHDVPGIPL